MKTKSLAIMLVTLKQKSDNRIKHKEKYGIQEEPIVALTIGYSTQKPLLKNFDSERKLLGKV